jgi:DNA repair protein RecN (Recombination protein N)
VWKRVAELATIEPQFAGYVDARDGIKSQLEDLAFFLRGYGEGVDASPGRLQQVEDRLALLDRLKRKYGPALQDVIDTGAALSRERLLLTGASEAADVLQRELAGRTATYLDAARALSARRRAAAGPFARTMESLLAELAMAGTRFEIRFNDSELPEGSWSGRGIDEAEFFLSPNVGEDLRPLARIVSGGELSRVMLALKTLAAQGADGAATGGDAAGKTLIFDEVDAGIGGRVAEVVGARLGALGRQFQVLCITHLAQIAAPAGTQFLIEKSVKGRRTATSVERLDGTQRVEEIARMIGGSAVTDAVRESAREILAQPSRPADRAKAKTKAKGESESRWPRST